MHQEDAAVVYWLVFCKMYQNRENKREKIVNMKDFEILLTVTDKIANNQ